VLSSQTSFDHPELLRQPRTDHGVASGYGVAVKIAIIQGHPDGGGGRLCQALADAYCSRAPAGGHHFRVIDIGRIDFPLLRTKSSFERGAVRTQLQKAQEAIAWADHLLLVYPLWLGEMPALVTGCLEQVMRPSSVFTVGGHGWNPRLSAARRRGSL
jgi:putative NADPH-quinone reductase